MRFTVATSPSHPETGLHVHFKYVSGETRTNKHDASSSLWNVSVRKGEEFASLRKLGMDLVGTNTKYCTIHLGELPRRTKAMAVYLLTKYIYAFDKYKKEKGKVDSLLEFVDAKDLVYVKDLLHKVGITYHVRDMINEPANVFTPEQFCEHAKHMFARTKVSVTVFDEHKIVSENLNLVYAVGKASKNKPRFLILDYKPKDYTKTFCVIGKGVTFDSGGVNLKTRPNNNYTMKGDKTGGCIVVGLLQYFSTLAAPHRVVGIVPLVENVISGNVTYPGDIITSYSGKTVEILDTDAEGRLILADALAYACKNYQPDYIFNFATLTGWADNLHCDTSCIYLAPGKSMFDMVEAVGEQVGERVWGLPRWMDLRTHCTSAVADLKNYDLNVYGCTNGSGYMAAMFLSHFVPKELHSRWVHFDITNNEYKHIMNANSLYLAMHLIHQLML